MALFITWVLQLLSSYGSVPVLSGDFLSGGLFVENIGFTIAGLAWTAQSTPRILDLSTGATLSSRTKSVGRLAGGCFFYLLCVGQYSPHFLLMHLVRVRLELQTNLFRHGYRPVAGFWLAPSSEIGRGRKVCAVEPSPFISLAVSVRRSCQSARLRAGLLKVFRFSFGLYVRLEHFLFPMP